MRKEVFRYITDRIKNKIKSRYSKFISPARKEILIKATVIIAVPAYTMSCFLLPKTLILDITRAMRRFLWSTNMDTQAMS